VGTIEDLVIPRTRGGFQTQLFEKYQRRQVELDQMIGDMFVQGVSQARVGTILETLNGVKPSASTVSRVFHTLEEEYAAWKTRELPEHYKYVYADGTYFSVIYGDEGQKTPVLALYGITPEGKREVIAMTIGESESIFGGEKAVEKDGGAVPQRGSCKVLSEYRPGLTALVNRFG
jgi:transposase-like protein